MAKKNKSIWQVRFEAIQQLLRWKISDIEWTIANKVLEDDLLHEEKETFKEQLKVYKSLQKILNDLSNQSYKNIYLESDY